MPIPSQSYTRNSLLGLLSTSDFALLQPHLERVEVTVRQPFHEADQPIEFVHFLEGGIGSIVAIQDGADEVEVGIFGREGISGTPVLLGVDRTPHRSFLQVGGATALRIASDRLVEACGASTSLHTLLLRYAQVSSVQAAQTAAANAQCELVQRLARWLLMCHDRVDDDTIALTHEFMAMMLAVRRAGVTVALHALEGVGAIRARRGLVTVLDRERLLEIAGQAYGAPEAEYRRLIGPFGKSPGRMGTF